MSHEIRTPMNGIIGMSDLLLGMPLDAEAHDAVGTIRRSADALLVILNDILDFSKVEAGKMEIERKPFELRTCLEDVFELLHPTAEKKSLRFRMDVDNGVSPFSTGDPGRVRQVILNLVGNALKSTPAGSVTVRARPAPERGRDWIRIDVLDTGIGIPDDKRQRLFETFSRVDSSHTRRFGGTGLGLSISKSLVELMGGAIECESVPDQGSTFSVFIPLPETSAPEPSRRPTGAPSEPDREHRPLRILLVDDNAVNRKVGAKILSSLGHHVDTADDGEASVESVRDGP